MNGVERVVHYATAIEQEAPHEIKDRKPKQPWPSHGQVEFKDVVFKYRPELPPVLKNITMTIHGGEKIGIVGRYASWRVSCGASSHQSEINRTGAGKSSIMVALYRLVELHSGSIIIDGVDISKLGLADVRSSISIIPQDPVSYPH